jgi:hypothetical protein
MRDWFSFRNVLVFTLFLVTSRIALSQEVQVAIVIIGDMHGEELKIRNDVINTSVKGAREQRAYFSLGKGDSSEILSRITKTTIYLKKRHHFKFKKISIPLPERVQPYLILKRDKKGKNPFIITWSDKLPFKLDTEKLVAQIPDTTLNVIPKPDLSIKLLGQQISAEQLTAMNPIPGRLLPLLFSFEEKGNQEIFPQLKSIEILFVIQQNQVVARNTYGKNYAISLFWPDRFPITQGSVILINVVYEYVDRQSKIVETGIVSKRINF